MLLVSVERLLECIENINNNEEFISMNRLNYIDFVI